MPDMSHPVFADPATQASYEKNGYVIADLFDRTGVEQLRGIAGRYDVNRPQTFYCTNWTTDKIARRNECAEIENFLQGRIRKLMPGYNVLYGCFIIKRFGKVGKIHPHIDWQFVQEPEFAAFNVWAPLSSTIKLNGAIWVVPGSHRFTDAKRGPNINISLPESLTEQRVDLPMRAGQALIYDTRLVHGSYPNLLPWKRIALASIVVPGAATVWHHYRHVATDTVTSYEVGAEFYRETCQFNRTEPEWELSESLK